MDKIAKINKLKRKKQKEAVLNEEKQKLLNEYNSIVESSGLSEKAKKGLYKSADDLYKQQNHLINEIRVEVATVAMASLMIHMHDCYNFGKKRLRKLFGEIIYYTDVIKKDTSRFRKIVDEVSNDYDINPVERMRYKPITEVSKRSRNEMTTKLYELSHIIPLMIYPLISRYGFGKSRISGIVTGIKQRFIWYIQNDKIQHMKAELLRKTGIEVRSSGTLAFMEV